MDLVDVVQEVAALHQEDVVNVGAGGRLMQGQAAEAYITGEVFVQHPSSCKILNVVFLLLCYFTCPIKPVPLELLPVVPLEHLVDAYDVASVVRAGPLMGRVNWGPRDCCHLKYFLV